MIFAVVAGICLFLLATNAQAEIRPGVRVGGYFDADAAFIGGELLTNISDSWFFNPNIEYVFVDNGDLVTFNFDVHYDLPSEGKMFFWIGGGPAILYFNPDPDFRDSETDFGINLFMGLGFKVGRERFIPYVQPKLILSDNSEFALAFGVRF
jgi:hypothetical protein